MDDNLREAGRIPRTVECELTADLGTVLSVLSMYRNLWKMGRDSRLEMV